jgi:hypothetical protein
MIGVVANREFDDYSLLGVYQWRTGFYGVVMLCPAGIHETLVFDCRGGKREVVYRDIYILKSRYFIHRIW